MDDPFKRVQIAYPVITVVLYLMKTSMVSMGANFRGNPAWSLISTLSDLFIWGFVIAIGLYVVAWLINAVDNWINEKIETKDKAIRELMRSELRDLKNEVSECHERIDELEEQRKEEERDKREKEYQEKKEQELRDRTPEDAVKTALESFLN